MPRALWQCWRGFGGHGWGGVTLAFSGEKPGCCASCSAQGGLKMCPTHNVSSAKAEKS